MTEIPMGPPPAKPPVLESEEDFLAWLCEVTAPAETDTTADEVRHDVERHG